MPNDLTKDAYVHLESVKAEAMALDESTLMTPRVSRDRLLELMTALSQRMPTVLDGAAALLSPQYLSTARTTHERLVPLALAYFAADLDTEAGFSGDEKARRAELAQKVHDYDQRLFPVLELLWGKHPQHGTTVASIRSGTGLRDDAADVLAGARLAELDPTTFTRQQVITPAQLEDWKKDATELLTLIDRLDPENPTRKVQRRVFTLAVRAFDDLNWIGRFATRDLEGWPAVSGRMAGKSSSDATSKATEPTTPDPSVPT